MEKDLRERLPGRQEAFSSLLAEFHRERQARAPDTARSFGGRVQSQVITLPPKPPAHISHTSQDFGAP